MKINKRNFKCFHSIVLVCVPHSLFSNPICFHQMACYSCSSPRINCLCMVYYLKSKQNKPIAYNVRGIITAVVAFYLLFFTMTRFMRCGKCLMQLLFPSVFLSSHFIFLFYSAWQNSTDSSWSHWRALHPGHHGSDICSLRQKEKHQKETSLEEISGDRGSNFTICHYLGNFL